MIKLLFLIVCVVCIFSFPFIRLVVLHPFASLANGARDIFNFFYHKEYNRIHDGYIVCFIGLFGQGKTLSSVRYVVRQYKRFNGKKVYDKERNKFVTQYVKVLSNVDLTIPFKRLTSLQQIVDISKYQHIYDLENDCITATLVLGDEFSVMLNSRNFKNNINSLFLNTLLTCRHHHIALIYNAQRFAHVDALLRQVTSYVFDCRKHWRFVVHRKFDAWDLENANNVNLVKPLRTFGWFCFNSNYSAYDTFACVDNLVKACEDNDFLSDSEILANIDKDPTDIYGVAHVRKRFVKKRK